MEPRKDDYIIMARLDDRERALALRREGLSYSQIGKKLDVSKSTLSNWLRDYPLSDERVQELRGNSEKRIERYRATMKKKREERRNAVYQTVARDMDNSRDIDFLSGFYLYWGEGTKTAEYTVSLTNSDPGILQCFLVWMEGLGVPRDSIRVKLHVYTDQNEKLLRRFWARTLRIPAQNFNKSYVKDSKSIGKTYKGMFSYGTCVLAYHDRDMHEYVMAGIQYLRDKYTIAPR